ncbi:MAG TPA: hypothetical protein VNY06_00555, partial [Methylocella sp.]|nr:hypothetical protein [Methylocella sp.]
RVFFRILNETPKRPRKDAVSETTRKRLEALNQYDIELYEWVKERFAKQIEPLEPDFSREVRRFEMLNRSVRRIRQLTPRPIHRTMKQLLLSPQRLSQWFCAHALFAICDTAFFRLDYSTVLVASF